MAKIPLRVYIKEIETLIERGEIDQAIAHAKSILKSYPKHIDTYRLLGKAYLESQRYSEAADILQRVLSVLPDDFISQIGMSIIREDEGNLDAAIWHMERAFEVQPFNPAVQDELRRLYGRRDGIQPPKIRLTRGALVRQYMRGYLYPQAIAETRMALSEDPQRLDLRVLLARLYYLAGQKNDAAETASELLQKLPYCFEANRIMAEILPSAGREEEAKQFQQRIYSLDPYQAFISPSAPSSEQVPDQAVMAEKYAPDEAFGEAAAPGWTQSVGIEWEEPEVEEQLPDWLNTLKPDRQTGSLTEIAPAQAAQSEQDLGAEEQPTGAEATSQEDIVPDWMKEAGWARTDRSADEIMAEQAQNEPAEEEIVEAEIPDWLQAMAPAQQETPQEEERTEWLENILEEPAADGEQVDQTLLAAPESGQTEDVESGDEWLTGLISETPVSEAEPAAGDFAWLAGSVEETPSSEVTEPTEAGDLPDWLQAEKPPEAAEEQAAPPDWLKSFESSTEEQPVAGEVPDWMQSLGQETDQQVEEGEQAPDWLSSFAAEGSEAEQEPQAIETPGLEAAAIEIEGAPEGEAALAGEASLPDWLQEEAEVADATTGQADMTLAEAERQPAEEVPSGLLSAEEAEPSAMPDLSDMDATMAWLEGLAAKQGADEATLITPPEERLEAPPDWVKKQTGDLSQALVEETPPVQIQPTMEELPQDLEHPEGLELPELELQGEETTPEAAPSEEIPDWLRAIEEAEAIKPPEVPAAPVAEIPVEEAGEAVEAGMPDFSDMDSAMAWLEGLAAKQGADEATLITPPDERLEAPPEWVRKQTGELPQAAVEEIEAAASTEAEEIAPTAEVEPTIEAISEELESIELAAPEALAAPEEAAVEEAAQPAELPDWLQGIEELETAQPAEAVPPAEEILAESPAQPATEETAMPDFSDMDAAMAWLEGLAAKQGADEATLITPPEQRIETPPEWVIEETEEPQAEGEMVEPVQTSEGTPVMEEAEESPVLAAFAEETALPAETLGEPLLVEEEAQVEPAEPMATATGEISEEPTAMDMEDAFAWLESLAAKHGAEEGSLITAPEERVEIPPEWVMKQTGQLPSLEEETVPEELSMIEGAELPKEETTIPVGLEQIEEQEAVAESPEIAEPPAWLETSEVEEPVAEGGKDEWLHGLGEQPLTEEATAEEAAAGEEIPAWLSDVGEALPSEAVMEDNEPLPDWLQEFEETEASAITTGEQAPAPAEFISAWEPEIEIPQPVAEVQPESAAEALGLGELQEALRKGDLDTALEGYNDLIQKDQYLEETIHDLRDALYRYPVDIALWQTLGDAYAKNNQLQEALDAYTKAEELLR